MRNNTPRRYVEWKDNLLSSIDRAISMLLKASSPILSSERFAKSQVSGIWTVEEQIQDIIIFLRFEAK